MDSLSLDTSCAERTFWNGPGVGPKSLVIMVRWTKIPAEQYRRFWSAADRPGPK